MLKNIFPFFDDFVRVHFHVKQLTLRILVVGYTLDFDILGKLL